MALYSQDGRRHGIKTEKKEEEMIAVLRDKKGFMKTITIYKKFEYIEWPLMSPIILLNYDDKIGEQSAILKKNEIQI